MVSSMDSKTNVHNNIILLHPYDIQYKEIHTNKLIQTFGFLYGKLSVNIEKWYVSLAHNIRASATLLLCIRITCNFFLYLKSDKSDAKLISLDIRITAEGGGNISANLRNDCLNFSSAAFLLVEDTCIKFT